MIIVSVKHRIVNPPTHPHLLSLVHRANHQADFHGEEFDIDQFRAVISGDQDTLVEDIRESIFASMASLVQFLCYFGLGRNWDDQRRLRLKLSLVCLGLKHEGGRRMVGTSIGSRNPQSLLGGGSSAIPGIHPRGLPLV